MTRVVVVGAGVAGCHVARELAPDHEVIVLDREGVAAGATGLSAGVVAPTLFYREVPAVARHANAFFRAFDGTASFSFTGRNRLDFVARGAGSAARADAAALADEGFPVAFRPADDLAADYPRISFDGFAGAVKYRDAGWVDPHSYAAALAADARARGARIETDVEVTGVAVTGARPSAGEIAGVETTRGTYEADAVVLAAGWRTTDLLPGGVDVPVRPYRTQVVVLEPDEPLPDAFPIGRVGSEHLYFRPEHTGDLLVGGGHGVVDDPGGASRDADEAFRLQVAEYVPGLVDGFDDAGFVNGWAGVDCATPDTRPVIDEVGPDGLVVATGFNGLGVMASPVVGPTVRERLCGEAAPFPTDPFALDRFDDVSAEFEYVSTSEV